MNCRCRSRQGTPGECGRQERRRSPPSRAAGLRYPEWTASTRRRVRRDPPWRLSLSPPRSRKVRPHPDAGRHRRARDTRRRGRRATAPRRPVRDRGAVGSSRTPSAAVVNTAARPDALPLPGSGSRSMNACPGPALRSGRRRAGGRQARGAQLISVARDERGTAAAECAPEFLVEGSHPVRASASSNAGDLASRPRWNSGMEQVDRRPPSTISAKLVHEMCAHAARRS